MDSYHGFESWIRIMDSYHGFGSWVSRLKSNASHQDSHLVSYLRFVIGLLAGFVSMSSTVLLGCFAGVILFIYIFLYIYIYVYIYIYIYVMMMMMTMTMMMMM